ncbi:unnamed protein product [Nippostrongylus brasiliensis]|uniref:PPIase FKBP-type domain-containing protein n=1 Tax=Nippostrongylus brasiliensis TaxID=27835 RepID=A0A3P7ACC8_NIPBR|nr:unnamed protein product [Nippostrongylus brasiliensis]
MLRTSSNSEFQVIIPPEEGFGDEDEATGVNKEETLYYFVELKSIFRPNPGDSWITDEGVHITVSRLP